MSCHLRVAGVEFTAEEIAHAASQNGLLAIEVELGEARSASESRALVAQARELGARQLILLSSDTTLPADGLDLLEAGREHGMRVMLFTDGRGVDRGVAQRLFERGADVILERSSLAPEIQDRLAGREGAHRALETAYRQLREAGYPAGDGALGVSSRICRQNQAELPRLWEWIRREGLVPYFEVPYQETPDGDPLSPEEQQALLEQLAVWDREHGGPEWDPQPPLVDRRCRRHLFSCRVDATGTVLPCGGLRLPVGDLRQRSLREILADSEVLENLRDYRHRIAGPCASCSRSDGCYGCRGSAYRETGDYLASDPLCLHNRGRQAEIARMPLAAAPLIPQRDPMRLVDTLRSVGERVAVAAVRVRAEMPFVDAAGRLSEAAYLEMMAQAAAAMGGFTKRGQGARREEGLMLGARNLEILGEARIGDDLEIEVVKSARLGGFGIVEGRVRRQGHVLARGEIKILQLGEAS